MAPPGAAALETADDERVRRIDAAQALRRRDLPRRKRRDIARIESRRRALLADRRRVELRYYPAPWQGGYGQAAEGGSRWGSRNDVAGEACKRISVSRRAGMTLYGLIREFSPRRALELGTGLGVSGAYQALALRHDACGGRLVALEGAPDLAAIAEETFAELGLGPVEVRVGAFLDTLPDVLAEADIDFAYVDGHHEERATLEYFELIVPRAPNAVLVFDDIGWSEGMECAWRRIVADERIAVAAGVGRFGVAITGRAGRRRRAPWRRQPKRPSHLVSRSR